MGQLLQEVIQEHEELCTALNVDLNTSKESWSSYTDVAHNYTLEGSQLHWLGCSLYLACRRATVPTVSSNKTIEGNLVCLTSLLKHCKMSLNQFLSKCKKWVDMKKVPDIVSVRSKISSIERNFAVSRVIFSKYLPIFKELFRAPNLEELLAHTKHNKKKMIHCTATKVFEFTWVLFILAKAEYLDVSDDLVNSFHLMLACCNLIYSNVIQSRMKDIINPNFEALPPNFLSPTFVPSDEPLCILDLLCKNHDGLTMEAKGIKEYCWRNFMMKLVSKQKLRGNRDMYMGLLEPENFDFNFKAVSKMYEEYILSVGDFDERIFLPKFQSFDEDFVNSQSVDDGPEPSPISKPISDTDFGIDFSIRRTFRQLTPKTPLTGRQYLSNRDLEHGNVAPVKTATQCVGRLNALLCGRDPEPSDCLVKMFRSCECNPQSLIESLIKTMGDKFCEHYSNNRTPSRAFAEKRLSVIITLYYKLLESILIDEQKKPQYDFNVLLSLNIFHETLFACCIEIVIFCYNSNRIFPWILSVFNLEAYHFYKVIEVIVRAEFQLSRDIVKHLNLIEEQVLESMAWKEDSPLWKNIEDSGQEIPTCEQVMLPSQLRAITLGAMSDSSSVSGGVRSSPLSERFQSPLSKPGGSRGVSFHMIEVDGVQKFLEIRDDSPTRLVMPPLVNNVKTLEDPLDETKDLKESPKRTGSLGLFFRKFYHLAFVRLEEFASKLDIDNEELKHKIWTCFEYSITHGIDTDGEHLMKSRHVDQLLMSAVYIICKVNNNSYEKTFTEIMKCYRLQPQSNSNVYRCVLLNRNQGKEERGDLIKFYNMVYVKVMQEFARRFSRQAATDALILSPLLVGKSNNSPSPYRRVSDKFAVYIRSMEHTEFPNAQGRNSTTYCFTPSPGTTKELQKINSMIQNDFFKNELMSQEFNTCLPSQRKRPGSILLDAAPGGSIKKPMNSRLQELVGERKSVLHFSTTPPLDQ